MSRESINELIAALSPVLKTAEVWTGDNTEGNDDQFEAAIVDIVRIGDDQIHFVLMMP